MNDTRSSLGQQRPPLSDTQYVILPLLALALAVALRPGWPVRIGGVLLHVLCTLNATKYSAGGGYEDYLKGSFLGCASLMALYNLVLTDPMMEWRHKSRPNTRPIDLPLWERVYWVFCAACNNRGLGWSFEVSGHILLISSTLIRLRTGTVYTSFAKLSTLALPQTKKPSAHMELVPR